MLISDWQAVSGMHIIGTTRCRCSHIKSVVKIISLCARLGYGSRSRSLDLSSLKDGGGCGRNAGCCLRGLRRLSLIDRVSDCERGSEKFAIRPKLFLRCTAQR